MRTATFSRDISAGRFTGPGDPSNIMSTIICCGLSAHYPRRFPSGWPRGSRVRPKSAARAGSTCTFPGADPAPPTAPVAPWISSTLQPVAPEAYSCSPAAIGQAAAEPDAAGPSLSYGDWIAKYDTTDDKIRILMLKRGARLALQPKLSIVMPVYNTDLRWLREAIESVRAQLYPHWELCISDDASTLPGVNELLREYADKDQPDSRCLPRHKRSYFCKFKHRTVSRHG